jgi:predicted chitinase
VRNRQALGDITPITRDDLWARAAEDMSNKPYKSLATDLLNAASQDRADAVDTFIASNHALETAQIDNPDFGRDAVKRFRAQAVNESLGRHLSALDHVLEESALALRDTHQAREARQHLRDLRAEAASAKRQIDVAEAGGRQQPSSSGPGL